MPQATDIRRARSRRTLRRKPLRRITRLVWAGGAALVLLAGFVIINGALLYAGIATGLPSSDQIESVYGPQGVREYQPVQIYDHSGSRLLFEAIHPSASERRWLRLDPVYNTLSVETLQAVVSAQDPTFWENNGYERGRVFETIISGIFSPHQEAPTWSITQQLAFTAILPLDGVDRSPFIQFLRTAALASDLTDQYSKRTILEWYLNTADFGNLCYGLDAAALAYFGRHASDLTLAESAMLAAIPNNPSQNPFDDLPGARRNQHAVLQSMLEAGVITQEQASQARREVLQLNQSARIDNLIPVYAQLAMDQADALLGNQAHQRPGLQIITTLDFDLQLQLECTLRTQQARLNGQAPTTTIPAADNINCLAAELLPPLRPGDANLDHQLLETGGVIFEPQTGRLLAMSGPVLEPRSSGTAYSPFIYLTAFSQGNSPGSMTLDIPLEGIVHNLLPDPDQYAGPQSMRASLVNDYNAATLRTLQLVGVDALIRIAQPLGLSLNEAMLEDEDLTQVPLYNLAYAYSVLANRGWMAGVDAPWEEGTAYTSSLQPAVITGILNHLDQALYHYTPIEKSIASPQLSYLINESLSDASSRQLEPGQATLFNVGRTTAIKNGVSRSGTNYWTIGYAPNLLVAIWAGSPPDSPPVEVSPYNSTLPIWHAIFRYISRDLSNEIWETPPGVSEVEVCDPSGLLPTQYCPSIVRETFISGTEPTRTDDLFLPILINRETGNLATVLTPLDLIEERVYMILPSEAAEWAASADIEQPPREYDSLVELSPENPEVRITSPDILDLVYGEIVIRGDAHPEEMESYRLLYGQGLNPTSWIEIGSQHSNPVTGGVLGRWDTSGLEGLYTLQLEVIDSEGGVMMDYIPLSLDNTPPDIELQLPEPGTTLSMADASSFIIQANIQDAIGLDEVRIYVNNRLVDSMESEPYSLRWSVEEPGEYEVLIRAIDLAGNTTESDPVTVIVTP
jgi:membrane peptidoglycan carboxypeptidase